MRNEDEEKEEKIWRFSVSFLTQPNPFAVAAAAAAAGFVLTGFILNKNSISISMARYRLMPSKQKLNLSDL